MLSFNAVGGGGVSRVDFDRGCLWLINNPTRNYWPGTKLATQNCPQWRKFYPKIIQGIFDPLTKFTEIGIFVNILSAFFNCDPKFAHCTRKYNPKSAKNYKILTPKYLRWHPKHMTRICGTSCQWRITWVAPKLFFLPMYDMKPFFLHNQVKNIPPLPRFDISLNEYPSWQHFSSVVQRTCSFFFFFFFYFVFFFFLFVFFFVFFFISLVFMCEGYLQSVSCKIVTCVMCK